jgi:hypothetical protein
MKRLLNILVVLLLAGVTGGCGGERDKGINKDKDLPREGPTAPAK